MVAALPRAALVEVRLKPIGTMTLAEAVLYNDAERIRKARAPRRPRPPKGERVYQAPQVGRRPYAEYDGMQMFLSPTIEARLKELKSK